MDRIITDLSAILHADPWTVRGKLREYIEELKVIRNKKAHEAPKQV